MDERTAMRRSRVVGIGSLAIGAVLLARPGIGRPANLDARDARLIAMADLAVGPGLIWGRPRRPWLFARAGANLGIAALLLRRGSRPGRAIAAALGAVTVADLQLAGAVDASGSVGPASAAPPDSLRAAGAAGAPRDPLRDGAAPASLNARLNLGVADVLNDRGIYLGRRSTKLHVALYRRSGGRLGADVPGFPGAKIGLLDHRGARSGVARTSPLMILRDGESVAVVASKAGQPTHPAWFHNLKANPETTVQVGREVLPVRARVASDAERDRLWPEFVALYPGYESYRERAHPRVIPIVILDPRV